MKSRYLLLLYRLCCFGLCITLYSNKLYANYIQETQPIAIDAHHKMPNLSYREQWIANLGRDVVQDFKHYAAPDRLWLLGSAFGTSAILGNTTLDKQVSTRWQSDIRSKSTDQFFKVPQAIGGFSYYYAPVYLLSVSLGHLTDKTLLGNVAYHWGYRSLRTFIVGGPQQAFFTYLIGSGRPNHQASSKWQPFRHNTGVSGHAFYGAIPFLTAAMMTDPPLLRYTVYALSTLPGLSRINSNYHYLSQVVLGWSMAYLSAASVYDTDAGRTPKFQVHVQPRSNGMMMYASMPF